MKRKIVLLVVLWVAPAFSQPLSQGERDFALSALHASRKMFLDAISGLSEPQWKYKPSPDRWSVAECAEHIIASEDFLYEMITEKVMKGPAASPAKPPTREQDEAVLTMVTDRSKKFNAPEPLRPSGRWASPEDAVRAFKERRDRTISSIRETEADLRGHAQSSRDAYQWFLFLSGHSERHTAQINEVKADPGYPK